MKISLKLFLLVFAVALLSSCKKDKTAAAVVGDAKKVAASAMGQEFNVDPQHSKVMWTGTKPTGSHSGTIDVSLGTITVKDDKITAGNFTMDMNTINNTDMEGDSKTSIEAHLKGQRDPEEADDFFNVVKYPTSKFEITKVTKLVNDPEASHLVYGNLTMRDVTKEIGIKAQIQIQEEGLSVTTPEFKIDRTDWGINYSSKSVFDNLKDKYIDDDIKLSITLGARASK